MVHHDDHTQEMDPPPKDRRHLGRLPHPRRRRLPRRHPHRNLCRARAVRPLPTGHTLQGNRVRRIRRSPAPETNRWRRIHHRLEHRRHFHHLRFDKTGYAFTDVGGRPVDWRRCRPWRRGLRLVGRRGEV